MVKTKLFEAINEDNLNQTKETINDMSRLICLEIICRKWYFNNIPNPEYKRPYKRIIGAIRFIGNWNNGEPVLRRHGRSRKCNVNKVFEKLLGKYNKKVSSK